MITVRQMLRFQIAFLCRFFFLTAFLFSASNAYAATYYFSTSGNNVTGNGTQANPFYSLCGPWANAGCATGESKISMGQLAVNAGDQLLFKRGDEWVGMNAVWTINATGAAGNPITFGAYGTSTLPRPIFRGAKSAFELGKDTWTNVSGTSIWYTTGISSWPNMAAQEETATGGPQLYGAWSVQGTTNANGWQSNQSMVRGTYYYETSTQRLYVWRTDNLKPDHAAGRDIYIGGAPGDGTNRLVKVNRGWAGTSTSSQFVGAHYVFQDLHAKMSSNYGFSTSYSDTQYINCLSELNGMEGFLFDRRRFGAPLPGAKDGVMRNCVARRNNLGQGYGNGQGVTIESENVWIYDSESYENAWAGVDFLDYATDTKTDGGGVVNSKVHNNGLHPVTRDSFDPNVYVDGGSNITIRDCQIWGAGVDPRGEKTRLRSNAGISIDVENAGKHPDNVKVINTLSYGNAGAAIQIGGINAYQTAVDLLSNIQVIGSTLSRDRGDNDIKGYYDPNVVDAGIRVASFNHIQSNFIFKNNIVLASNTARAPVFGNSGMYNAGKSRMDFDNNVYYCPGCNFNTTGSFNSGGFFSYAYISNMTIDQFRNLSGAASVQQDAALTKTTIMADPLMLNTTYAAFDAHLQTNSPALNIATTSIFPAGITGTTRADGAADSPYNDLGFHHPLTGGTPPPPADTQAPTAPTGLSGVISGSQILLTWNASTDNTAVTGYQVFDGSTLLGTSTSLGYTFQNAVLGQSYYFSVKAFDAANNFSLPSNTVTLTVGDSTAPTTPLNLAASLSGTQVTLTWTASTDNIGVAGYQILNNGTQIGTSTSAGYVHSATGGITYNYAVKAFDAGGNYSPASNLVTVTVPVSQPAPPVPTNFAASYVSGQVQLSWNASANAAGYEIYRDNIFLKSITTTSSFDNAVTAGNAYAYKVDAYDTSNVKSSFSNSVSVTVPGAGGPTPPTNLAATAVGYYVQLNWTNGTNCIGYNIYRNGSYLTTVGMGQSHQDLAVVAGNTYRYKMESFTGAGVGSGFTSEVSVTLPGGTDTTSPSAPTNLTSSLNSTTANLSWSASTDNVAVTGYQVFSNGTLSGNTASTTYSVSGLTQGQTYAFTVKAQDAAGNLSASSSSSSVSVPLPPDTQAPSVPVLAGTVSGTQAILSWAASTDNVAVTGYQLFENSVLKGTTAALTYTASGLLSGQGYSYTVRATDAANNLSAASNAVMLTVPGPSTPTNLIAFLAGSSVNVAWSTATNATGYALYRNSLLLQNLSGVSFTDSAVSTGQTYDYKVQAFDDANNLSAFSNSMSVNIPLPTDTTSPSAPTNLTSSLNSTTANLSWSASTDNVAVTGYQVFSNGTLSGNTASTTYSVSGLTQGQTYAFTVKAQDAAGNLSASSSSSSVSVPLPPDTQAPSTPSNLTASLSGTTVDLSWNASTDNIGVTGYQVFEGAILKGTSSSTAYSVNSLAIGPHSFTVKAFDAANNISTASNSTTATVSVQPLAAPTNLSATVSGNNLVLFNWNDSSGSAGYNLYRNGAFLKDSTFNATADRPGNGVFTYYVQAYGAAGQDSPFSNGLTVNTSGKGTITVVPADTQAPSVPQSVQATLSNNEILISWSPSSDNVGIDHYNVMDNFSIIGQSSSTNYTVSSVAPGTTHMLSIQACDTSYNYSPWSSGVSVTAQPLVPDVTAPSIPTNLTSSLSGSTVNLSWTSSTDNVAVTGYQVFEGAILKGTSFSAAYSVTSLAIGSHSFTVKAYDAANNISAASNSTSATVTDTTSPSAPTNLTSSLNSTTANLSWSASTDNVAVTGYQVFSNGTLSGNTASTTYSVSGLTQGQTYAFTVKAQDAAGNLSASSSSSSVSVPSAPLTPTPPTNLAATAVGYYVQLNWTNGTNCIGYNIYRNGSYLTTVGMGQSHQDLAVVAGNTYRYKMESFTGAGVGSGFTSEVSVTLPGGTDTTNPTVPSNLTAVLNASSVSLNWGASTDNVAVTNYQIFSSGVVVGTSTTTSFTFSPIAAGQTYYFTIKARDAAGNVSAASNTVVVIAPATLSDTTAPSAPTSLVANRGGSFAFFTWTASSDNVGVTEYQIFNYSAQIGSSATPDFTYRMASAKATYQFTVKAVDAAGNVSSPSNTVTMQT